MAGLNSLGYWPTVNAVCHAGYAQTGLVLSTVSGRGLLDASGLNRCLQSAYVDYPALLTEVVEVDGDFSLRELASDAIPVLEERHGNPEILFSEGEKFMAEGISTGVFRIALVRQSSTSDRWLLMTLCHHAICDGLSMFMFLEDLLCWYSDPVSTRAPAGIAGPDVAELSLSGDLRPASSRKSLGAPQEWPLDMARPLAERQFRWRDIPLDADTLQPLLAACRRHGVSLSNLLAAALIVVGTAASGAVNFSSTISLRGRVSPDVPVNAFGCYMGVMNASIERGDDIWETASNAKVAQFNNLRAVLPPICRGSIVSRVIEAQLIDANERGVFPSGACLANLGRIGMPEQIGELQIYDVMATVNQLAGFYSFFLCASSQGDRLRLTISYAEPLLSELHADSIASEIARILTDCGAEK